MDLKKVLLLIEPGPFNSGSAQGSLAARQMTIDSSRAGADLPAGVWFQEPCQEMTVLSEKYDFTISLLQLENDNGRQYPDDDEEEERDLVGRIRRNHGL